MRDLNRLTSALGIDSERPVKCITILGNWYKSPVVALSANAPHRHMSPPISYQQGDARNEVLSDVQSDPRAVVDELPATPELFDLSTDEYWEWLSTLVDEGNELDQELDELLDRVYDCEPSFYKLSEQRRLQDLLTELHEARASVRAFEFDVEELTYVFARTEAMESQAAENADMALSQIKSTYNRAYDLCLYKLDRIGNGWITASNFLISIVMLIVTILFWMEFR